MNQITIDETKCKHDGACVAECPVGIIMMADKKSLPKIIPGGEEFCISCGHCVAVCPHGALAHTIARPEDLAEVKKEWMLSPEHAEHFLRSRRSIRAYKDKAVDRETLERLIGVARHAPSGHNVQPVQWMVVSGAEKIRELSGAVIDWMRYMIKEKPEIATPLHMDGVVLYWEMGRDMICRNAPHILVAHAPRALPQAATDGTIALAYLELAAPSLGLGTCWAGYFHVASLYWPGMKTALGLPDGHVSLGAMMVGYPKYGFHRLPERNAPKIIWR